MNLINETMHPYTDERILTIWDKEGLFLYNKTRNIDNLRLRQETLSKKFKGIIQKLYLSEDFKFHYHIHTTITELLKNIVPLNIVKEIVGHRSITTILIYLNVKSDDLQQVICILNY